MIVRPATVRDIEEMVAIGARWHSLSDHAYVKFDQIRAGMFAMRAISSRGNCALVAEHLGKIVGMLIGTIQEWPFLNLKVATDLLTLSERAGAGRALLRQFEAWAFASGADEMMLGVSFGGDPRDCEKIYKRAGYRHIGGMFAKRRQT
jgi:GNAT superfamily N-acetyltransferase